ncbi:Alkaline phosphatase synthesis sensor protein PhoR [compost metagenome]
MDKEAIPHIFERFYRADESRGVTPGTGLGLSIAKWIIDEHGGSIEVTTRTGIGTRFTVWLPVSFRQMEE